MSSKEQISTILRKYDFSDIQVVHLDRTKSKGNRAAAKAFAAKVDGALSRFQDSDVYLLALTVKHKP
jgi:galactitol-specific phosphotransferase system IIB component